MDEPRGVFRIERIGPKGQVRCAIYKGAPRTPALVGLLVADLIRTCAETFEWTPEQTVDAVAACAIEVRTPSRVIRNEMSH